MSDQLDVEQAGRNRRNAEAKGGWFARVMRVEEARRRVEELIEKPLGKLKIGWRRVGEGKLGGCEEKLVAIEAPELVGRYGQLRDDALRVEVQSIRDAGDFRAETVKEKMKYYFRQEGYGGERVYGCGAACILNAMEGLGVRKGENEQAVVQQLKMRNGFNEDGYLRWGSIADYLTEKELKVRESANLAEVVQTLMDGGVAMIANKKHAQLIVGAVGENGVTSFWVHDPTKREPQLQPMSVLEEELNRSQQLANILLIEKQKV